MTYTRVCANTNVMLKRRSDLMDTEKPSQTCSSFRCWPRILGVVFFVLAAVCEFYVGFQTHQQNTGFRDMLHSSSVTARDIQTNMLLMFNSRIAIDFAFSAGLGFMMLGFACLLSSPRCCCCQRKGSDEA